MFAFHTWMLCHYVADWNQDGGVSERGEVYDTEGEEEDDSKNEKGERWRGNRARAAGKEGERQSESGGEEGESDEERERGGMRDRERPREDGRKDGEMGER